MKAGKMYRMLVATCMLSFGLHAAEKPNILVIVADDMARSDLASFGGEIETPTLDALAGEGVRLSGFHTAPNCSPSRAMLLTGVDNHVAGLGNMSEFMQPEQRGKPGYENRLNERAASFAEVFQDAGYNTYMTGKWHLGRSEEHSPLSKGFDKSYVLIQGGASHFYDMKGFWGRDPKALYREDGKEVDVPEGFFSTDFYTDRMIEYIDSGRKSGKPFFAYLAYTAPHWPLQAPEEWIDKYKGRYDRGYEALRQERLTGMKNLGLLPADVEANLPMASGLPAWEQLSEEQRKSEARVMELYAAMVSHMDHGIGRVIDHLKNTGLYDNTLIVFLADNGASGNSPANIGNNREWIKANFDNSLENMGRQHSFVDLGAQWAQVAAAPSPMYKGFTTQGGINTPAIIRYPDMPGQGSVISATTHVMDIMPTALELAGVEHPGKKFRGREVHPLQGRSMLPLIKGEAVPERVLGWELFDRRALRKGDWKLVMIEKPYGKGEWELYNIARDPSESQDLATAEPEKMQELLAGWDAYVEENGVILVTPEEKPGARTCLYQFCFE